MQVKRVVNELAKSGHSVESASRLSDAELMKLPNIGRKAVELIRTQYKRVVVGSASWSSRELADLVYDKYAEKQLSLHEMLALMQVIYPNKRPTEVYRVIRDSRALNQA